MSSVEKKKTLAKMSEFISTDKRMLAEKFLIFCANMGDKLSLREAEKAVELMRYGTYALQDAMEDTA